MPTRRLFFAVLSGSLTAVLPAFVSCGNSDSSGGGSGGSAASMGGAAATGAFGGAMNGSPDAAAGGTPFLGSGGQGGGGTTCKQTHEACTVPTDCCAGNTCTNNDPIPELRGCQITCKQNSDCASGCCRMFTGGTSGGFCADAMWCGCGMTASRCSPMLPACCNTHVCLAGDQQATFYECRQKCTQNSDCDTQCCVPISQLGVSACLDRMYCP